jgi:hypothetical protein
MCNVCARWHAHLQDASPPSSSWFCVGQEPWRSPGLFPQHSLGTLPCKTHLFHGWAPPGGQCQATVAASQPHSDCAGLITKLLEKGMSFCIRYSRCGHGSCQCAPAARTRAGAHVTDWPTLTVAVVRCPRWKHGRQRFMPHDNITPPFGLHVFPEHSRPQCSAFSEKVLQLKGGRSLLIAQHPTAPWQVGSYACRHSSMLRNTV